MAASQAWSVITAAGLSAACFALAMVGRPSLTASFVDSRQYEDVYYLPSERWLPVLSLGYHRALADLLWIKGLLYFSNELRHRGDASNAARYAEAMLALDPDFKAVYRWIGMAMLYRTGDVTAADAERAADFLRRGAERYPTDGELAWDLGATLRYELVPLLKDPAKKEEAKHQGVAHMQAAARLGAGPPWLVLTNATELRKLGRKEQAIRHLEEMYAGVQDPDIKQQIAVQLEGLRGAAYQEGLAAANHELHQRHQQALPYVNETLFLMLDLVAPMRAEVNWGAR